MAPSGGSEWESVPGLCPSFRQLPATLRVLGLQLHHFKFCLSVHGLLICMSVSMYPNFTLLPLIKTPVIGFWVYPPPGWVHLNLQITSAKTVFPNKVTFTCIGVRSGTYLLGHTSHPLQILWKQKLERCRGSISSCSAPRAPSASHMPLLCIPPPGCWLADFQDVYHIQIVLDYMEGYE